MSCSCIKNNSYNFSLYTPDNKNIIYTDLSQWMQDENYIIPVTYKVKIYYNKSILKEVDVYTKHSTAITFDCIHDGPYTFEVSYNDVGCGTTQSKQTVLIPNLWCCYKQLLAIEGVTDSSNEILKYIQETINNADIQNIKAANDTFKVAKKLLERIKCNC